MFVALADRGEEPERLPRSLGWRLGAACVAGLALLGFGCGSGSPPGVVADDGGSGGGNSGPGGGGGSSVSAGPA